MKTYILITALILSVLSTAVMAEVPPVISYQGKLMQPNGTPIPDGTYSIHFAIYDAPTGGDALWGETNSNVLVKGGLFAVLLGSVNNLGANILDSQSRYLGMKLGTDDELAPRQRIASVATALRAGEADVAKTVPDGAITTSKLADAAVTTDKLADGSIVASKIVAGSISSTVLSSADFRPDNRLVPPREKMAWTIDGYTYVWHYEYTSNFSNWEVSTSGGSVDSIWGEGIGVNTGTGSAGVYTVTWAPVAHRPAASYGRFIVRWRTSTNASGFVALLRCGTGCIADPDLSFVHAESKGQGFKQVGNKLYAYFDSGLGGGQQLTPIADITGPWQRFLGEVEKDGNVIRYYLNGELKHTLTLPAQCLDDQPLGRISLAVKNAGMNGKLDVNWVMKSGWGE